MSWELGALAIDLFLGFGQGLLGASSQRSAALAANKETKKLNEANFKRDTKTWEIDFLSKMSQYAWQMAETEAARYTDAVAKADYEKQQSTIIDSTIQNLLLNSEALTDKYVTAENIRYKDEVRSAIYDSKQLGLGFQGEQLDTATARMQNRIDTKGQLANSKIGQMLALDESNQGANLRTKINNMQYRDNRGIIKNNRALELGLLEGRTNRANQNVEFERDTQVAFNNMEAAQSNRQAMTAVAQYMQGIKAQKIQSDALLAQTENKGADIQEQILLGEQLDTLERDAQYVAAITESAVRKNQAAVRQGGSNSSNKISLDAMQAFGRTYGEMRVQQNARRQAMANYNASVQGEVAQEFAAIANQTQTLQKSISATKDLNTLRNNEYKFNDSYLKQSAQLQINDNNSAREQDRFSIRQQADDQLTQLLNNRNGFNATTEYGRQSTNRRARYERTLNDISTKANSKLNRYGINKGFGLARQDYRADFVNNRQNFNRSTVPGFNLANRQGQREYQALIQNSFNAVNSAATPYREAIINDPLLPIAGLAPELKDSKEIYVPSTGSIVLQAGMGAARTLMSRASTDNSGNLTFYR